MALVCDLPAVVKEFKSKTETVPTAYGELWKRTHAPDLSPLAGLGKSLDPNEQNRRTSQRKSDVSQASKQAEASKASNKTKIIVFEPPKQSPQKLFSYEPIANVVVQHSALSSIVGHVSKIDVMVFIPQHRRPVRLKVAQTATFQQLIAATIKSHNETQPKIALYEEPEAYLVRIATEDGQIDDMFPAVALKRQVDEWLNQPFMLVENPNYIKNASLERPSADSGDQKILIKAILPDGAYHMLAFDKTTKMSKVLKAICEKRALMPHDYTLQSLTDPPTYINRDMKVGDLKENNVRLVPKTEVMTAIDKDDPEIVWYEALAVQYKTYNVVFFKNKGKPFGSKQHRIIGIDGERITHTVIKKNATKVLPQNSIREVKSASTPYFDKPATFILEMKDNKTMTFEAPTAAVAKEIVGKIMYILHLPDKRPSGQ